MEMVKFAIVIVAISSMCSLSMGQSGISSSCGNILVTLSPCLNYITGNSSTPSSSCCSELASVVKSNSQCLCEALNVDGSTLAGLNINKTQALGLPNACNVQTPPLTTCNTASPPSGSTSTAGSPEATPSSSTSSGIGGGSKTTPTTQGDSSDAKMLKSANNIPLFLALFLFVVSHTLPSFNVL